MTSHIHKCIACDAYTLREVCQRCGQETIIPRPAKYSPEDKYSRFRRQVKRQELERAGLA